MSVSGHDVQCTAESWHVLFRTLGRWAVGTAESEKCPQRALKSKNIVYKSRQPIKTNKSRDKNNQSKPTTKKTSNHSNHNNHNNNNSSSVSENYNVNGTDALETKIARLYQAKLAAIAIVTLLEIVIATEMIRRAEA